MANLPTKTDLTSSATTEASFQGAIGGLYDYIAQLVSGAAPEAKVIASDAVTPSRTYIIVDTEASASTDILKNILPTNVGAKVIFVRSTSSVRVVTLDHLAGGTGQLKMNTGADAVLDSPDKFIAFVYDTANTRWNELWRNWGIFLPGSSDLAAVTTALGLGSAAFLNSGGSSGQVPTNALLGDLAYVDQLTNIAQIANLLITGAKIAEGTLALSKLANDTAGNIPVFNTSGVISKIPPVAAGRFLRDNGSGQVPSFEALTIPDQSCVLLDEIDVAAGALVDSFFPSWPSGVYSRILFQWRNVKFVNNSCSLALRVFNNGTEYSGNAFKHLFGAPPYNLTSVSAANGWTLTSTVPNTSTLNGEIVLSLAPSGSLPHIKGHYNVSGTTIDQVVGVASVTLNLITGFRIFRNGSGNFSTGILTVWGFK